MPSRLRLVVVMSLSALLVGQGIPDPAPGSELRDLIEGWRADRGAVDRRYAAAMSEVGRQRRRELHEGWRTRLQALDFATLSRPAQIDWLLFDNHLRRELASIDRERGRDVEVAVLLPWTSAVVTLLEARERVEPVDASATAEQVSALAEQVESALAALRSGKKPAATLARRAADRSAALQAGLGEWFRFRDGYDPMFSWWLRKPYDAAKAALDRTERFLRDDCIGKADDGGEPLVGDPIGKAALLEDLQFEFIPYSPQELVQLAEREFAWCDTEFGVASTDLGFAGDWRRAQEHVKGLHVGPGEQPQLILRLAAEAEQFLRSHDLVTVPPLASETWRMQMMAPARQLVSPFFLGGECIIVSFPTDQMAHRDKLASMRGNNIHFARATVHHELIPGHHLQQFMQARHRPYRRLFETPFWIEGWALYWEMLLYELGFPDAEPGAGGAPPGRPSSAADRVGMLFWRKHRCARIIFSLRYHLGEWTAAQCIDFLVSRVGHDRQTATAEVRRSILGNYSPLYQAGYMLGGLQLRALRAELVGAGKLTLRAFHDAVLRENCMPIELLRAALGDAPLVRDFEPSWRFYER